MESQHHREHLDPVPEKPDLRKGRKPNWPGFKKRNSLSAPIYVPALYASQKR